MSPRGSPRLELSPTQLIFHRKSGLMLSRPGHTQSSPPLALWPHTRGLPARRFALAVPCTCSAVPPGSRPPASPPPAFVSGAPRGAHDHPHRIPPSTHFTSPSGTSIQRRTVTPAAAGAASRYSHGRRAAGGRAAVAASWTETSERWVFTSRF